MSVGVLSCTFGVTMTNSGLQESTLLRSPYLLFGPSKPMKGILHSLHKVDYELGSRVLKGVVDFF